MLFIMLAAAYPFGRPEDEQLKPSKKMHVMLQATPLDPTLLPRNLLPWPCTMTPAQYLLRCALGRLGASNLGRLGASNLGRLGASNLLQPFKPCALPVGSVARKAM